MKRQRPRLRRHSPRLMLGKKRKMYQLFLDTSLDDRNSPNRRLNFSGAIFSDAESLKLALDLLLALFIMKKKELGSEDARLEKPQWALLLKMRSQRNLRFATHHPFPYCQCSPGNVVYHCGQFTGRRYHPSMMIRTLKMFCDLKQIQW